MLLDLFMGWYCKGLTSAQGPALGADSVRRPGKAFHSAARVHCEMNDLRIGTPLQML